MKNPFTTSATCFKLAQELTAAQAERDDLQASADLRWKADMRAIKRWQETTGRAGVWPDHADLCVWLLGQIKEAVDALEPFVEYPPNARTPEYERAAAIVKRHQEPESIPSS